MADKSEKSDPTEPQYMEIDITSRRSRMAWVMYLLFFAAVAGLLVYLLINIGVAFWTAACVVVFMIAYMLWMARHASKS